jgi:hypothetical protein
MKHITSPFCSQELWSLDYIGSALVLVELIITFNSLLIYMLNQRTEVHYNINKSKRRKQDEQDKTRQAASFRQHKKIRTCSHTIQYAARNSIYTLFLLKTIKIVIIKKASI